MQDYVFRQKKLILHLIAIIFLIAAFSTLFFLKEQYNSNNILGPETEIEQPFVSDSSETQPKKQVRITFVGDVMLDRYIRQAGERNGFDYIFSGVSPLLRGADLVVANLEGPVTRFQSRSVNTTISDPGHYTFTFPPQALSSLFNNNIRIVTVANNHILDFGIEGLQQTRTYLEEHGIEYFGDPRDEAKEAIMVEIENIKIGFVAYNEFISPNPEGVVQKIRHFTDSADFIFAYAHWGDEYAKRPNSKQISLARLFVDAGADLVMGAHPHVVQNKEIYKGKRIYYSLGNFVFDQYFSEDVRCGAMVTLIISNETMDFEENFSYLTRDGATAASNCLSEVPVL